MHKYFRFGLCVAETHLYMVKSLFTPGLLYGQSRVRMRVNARTGSGNVCLLVRKNLLEHLEVKYWIKQTGVYYGLTGFI